MRHFNFQTKDGCVLNTRRIRCCDSTLPRHPNSAVWDLQPYVPRAGGSHGWGGWEGGRSAELRLTLTDLPHKGIFLLPATDAQISVPFKEVTVNAAVESEAKVEEARLGAASGLWRAARSTLRSAAAPSSQQAAPLFETLLTLAALPAVLVLVLRHLLCSDFSHQIKEHLAAGRKGGQNKEGSHLVTGKQLGWQETHLDFMAQSPNIQPFIRLFRGRGSRSTGWPPIDCVARSSCGTGKGTPGQLSPPPATKFTFMSLLH